MLEVSDEEPEPAEPPPAPTTSALPKKEKKEKHMRRKPEAAPAAAEPEADEAMHIGRRKKRSWEEDEGEKVVCFHLRCTSSCTAHLAASCGAPRVGCRVSPETVKECSSCVLSAAEDDAAREATGKEAEMERDQREKEEFEARLKARDDEKTRRIVEQRIPKEELEVGCAASACCA